MKLTEQYQELQDKEQKLVAKIWDKLDENPLTIPFGEYSELTISKSIERSVLGIKDEPAEGTLFENIIAVISSKEFGSNEKLNIELEIDKEYPSLEEKRTGIRLCVVDELAKHFGL